MFSKVSKRVQFSIFFSSKFSVLGPNYKTFYNCGGLSIIRAKDVEPKLSGNVNILKKYSDADKTICQCKKYLCVDMAILRYPKILCWFRLWVKCKPMLTYLTTHAIFQFSSSLLVLSFYPLCLIPRHDLPVFGSHKKCTILL